LTRGRLLKNETQWNRTKAEGRSKNKMERKGKTGQETKVEKVGEKKHHL
jgi:hypothetical protein